MHMSNVPLQSYFPQGSPQRQKETTRRNETAANTGPLVTTESDQVFAYLSNIQHIKRCDFFSKFGEGSDCKVKTYTEQKLGWI